MVPVEDFQEALERMEKHRWLRWDWVLYQSEGLGLALHAYQDLVVLVVRGCRQMVEDLVCLECCCSYSGSDTVEEVVHGRGQCLDEDH